MIARLGRIAHSKQLMRRSALPLPLEGGCTFQKFSGMGLEAESSLIIDCLANSRARRACARSRSASVSLSVTARASAHNKSDFENRLREFGSANQGRWSEAGWVHLPAGAPWRHLSRSTKLRASSTLSMPASVAEAQKLGSRTSSVGFGMFGQVAH
jgi:hypothetical protein